MLFFPLLTFSSTLLINMAAALLPAIFLMRYIYRKDTVEKEPGSLLFLLCIMGVVAGLLSIALETVGTNILNATMISPSSPVYAIAMAFLVVAVVEEGTKFLLMKKVTWRNPNFNYRFDAVVYAVFTSLGFAGFENILYVFQYGLSVALPRAILSIPGHMAFAVVMGVFYGRAKLAERYGETGTCKAALRASFLWAVILHGFYDACLMVGSGLTTLVFLVYVVVMYISIFRLIKRESISDEPV